MRETAASLAVASTDNGGVSSEAIRSFSSVILMDDEDDEMMKKKLGFLFLVNLSLVIIEVQLRGCLTVWGFDYFTANISDFLHTWI